eukprot:scaffold61057_cov15-Prasinocladus_malaysianus.AAC.1
MCFEDDETTEINFQGGNNDGAGLTEVSISAFACTTVGGVRLIAVAYFTLPACGPRWLAAVLDLHGRLSNLRLNE